MKATNQTTVIVADLGKLRAFRVKTRGIDDSQLALEEIMIPVVDFKPKPVHQVVSDQAGRFPRGGGAGSGLASGEEHEAVREVRDRSLATIASTIESILAKEASETWMLAAPDSIAEALGASVSSDVRSKLVETLRSDLTGFPIKKIEERFL